MMICLVSKIKYLYWDIIINIKTNTPLHIVDK